MLTTPAYIPRPGALPEKVLAYFAANPEECLTAEDIAEKFGAIRSNVHTQLRAALDAGCLKRSMSDDGYTYTLGDQRPVPTQPRPTAKQDPVHLIALPREKRKTGSAALVHLDLAALVVDDNVPFAPRSANTGANKWAPLFAKLTKKGQSVAIPANARGAIGAAANKANKSGLGKFRVALVPGGARVWRVE